MEKPLTKKITSKYAWDDFKSLVNLNFDFGSLHEFLNNMKSVVNQHANIINKIKTSNDEKLDEEDLAKILHTTADSVKIDLRKLD